MKNLITFALLTSALSSQATIPLDSIPFWNIYYGKVIMIQGNTSQATTKSQEIRIKNDVVSELVITFNHCIGGPIDSEIKVKVGDKTLRTVKSHLKENSFFMIPIRELIDTKTEGKRYELDFYYSDDRGAKGLKLGTIIFTT